MDKFGHLVIMCSDGWDRAEYPDLFVYVVNTISHKAYFVPPYVRQLAKAKVVPSEPRFKTFDDLVERFKEMRVVIVDRLPKPGELKEGTT